MQLVSAPRVKRTVKKVPKKPKKKEFPIPTQVSWLFAGLIIAGIIALTIFLIIRTTRETLEVPTIDEIPNLDELIDLEAGGQCCVPPAQATATARWIYLPSTDRTYSLDKTDVDVVCQGQIGSNLTQCQAEFGDANGQPKVVAHKGIELYYGFSIGQPGGVCDSFTTCP